jgi:transmembrane 9 superfamily protein 2/4
MQPPNIVRLKQALWGGLTGHSAAAWNTPYELAFKQHSSCRQACAAQLSSEDVAAFVARMDGGYLVRMAVDGLPAAIVGADGSLIYGPGFPIGTRDPATGTYTLNNVLRLAVWYHDDGDSAVGAHIVEYPVEPRSVRDVAPYCGNGSSNDLPPFPLYDPAILQSGGVSPPNEMTVAFAYEVVWLPSSKPWASRWDVYLAGAGAPNTEIHWFSFFNSALICFFVGAVATLELRRASQVSRGTGVPLTAEEARAATSWKALQGDVFRPPATAPIAHAVVVGVGTQLAVAVLGTTLAAAVGVVARADPSSLAATAILLYAAASVLGGYVAVRVYSLIGATAWRRVAYNTAVWFPASVLTLFAALSAVQRWNRSTGGASAGSLVGVGAIWLLVITPLTFVGARAADRALPMPLPVRVAASTVPRAIPRQPWYLRLPAAALAGGMLPAGVLHIESHFAMTAAWGDGAYFSTYGFTLTTFLLALLAAAGAAAVLATYLPLTHENYRWPWRAVIVPAVSAAYWFAFATYFQVTRLALTGTAPIILFYAHAAATAVCIALVAGAAGYGGSLAFLCVLYRHAAAPPPPAPPAPAAVVVAAVGGTPDSAAPPSADGGRPGASV